MPELSFADATFVACSPEALYDLISDVTRMGEWSPICRACWWDDGSGPLAGNWFTGRNETPDRVWETRSQVVIAEPGREFTFVVGGDLVRDATYPHRGGVLAAWQGRGGRRLLRAAGRAGGRPSPDRRARRCAGRAGPDRGHAGTERLPETGA